MYCTHSFDFYVGKENMSKYSIDKQLGKQNGVIVQNEYMLQNAALYRVHGWPSLCPNV